MASRIPPYLPFSDFLTALDAIAPNPPAHIDAYLWSHLPELRPRLAQLCGAFEFLGLSSESGESRSVLHTVLNPGTRARGLAEALRRAYPLVDLNMLRTTTRDRLQQAFKRQHPTGTLWQKSLSFYLKAAEAAKIELSPSLAPRKRVRRSEGGGADESSLVIAACGLRCGGSLQLLLRGESLESLAPDELELATAAALLLKSRKE